MDPARQFASPGKSGLSDASLPRPVRARRFPLELVLLFALIAAVILPLWLFKYFPSTDGGAHVASADVLLKYFRPGGAAHRQYFELTRLPVPNSGGHFALAGLMLLFTPPVAEKVFVSLYLLLLPLAVRYAITAVRRSSAFLAFLAVPLSLNWITHQGFYNFCGSVIVFFLALGYWLRHRERMNARRAIALGLLGLLLYFEHLISIFIFIAAISILATWFTAIAARRLRQRGTLTAATLWPGFKSRAVIAFVALAPAMILAAWFHHRGYIGKPHGLVFAIRNKQSWKDLLSLNILISYRRALELPWARGTAAVILLLVAAVVARKLMRRSPWQRRDGLIFLPLAIVGLYFTQGSDAAGQLFIPQRLIFFIYLTALLFIATQSHPIWLKRAVPILCTLLALALTAAHYPSFKAYNAQLAEFIGEADRIEPRATFLSLIFSPRGEPPVSDDGLTVVPFFSAQGYAAASRGLVDLRIYEAGLDYFPVRYRSAVDPFKHLARLDRQPNGLMDVPQRIDLAAYEHNTPGRVDYVLIWGKEQAAKNGPVAIDTFAQLRNGYDLIHETAHAQLWRRRNR